MREGWQQFLKRRTRWRRYACGQCLHRGWTRLPLPHSDHPEEQSQRLEELELPGRPLEARDRRERRLHRAKLSKAAFLALFLGSLLAVLISLLSRR